MPCRPGDLAFQVRRTGRLPDRITCELPSNAFRARCTSDSPFFVYEMHTYARLYLIGFKVRWLSKYLFTVRRDNESKLAISLASNPLSYNAIASALSMFCLTRVIIARTRLGVEVRCVADLAVLLKRRIGLIGDSRKEFTMTEN